MGDGAHPNPYPDENPHLLWLPDSICMYVTDNEAGISKIVREVYGNLPEINEDPDFLADISIIPPPPEHAS
jgi:hypothetical protein